MLKIRIGPNKGVFINSPSQISTESLKFVLISFFFQILKTLLRYTPSCLAFLILKQVNGASV